MLTRRGREAKRESPGWKSPLTSPVRSKRKRDTKRETQRERHAERDRERDRKKTLGRTGKALPLRQRVGQRVLKLGSTMGSRFYLAQRTTEGDRTKIQTGGRLW